jgi:hypothetical protein
VRSHAQELSSEIRSKEKLSQKLDSYIDVVKRAEIERDDIRDAILQLIEKGGSEVLISRKGATTVSIAHVGIAYSL